MLTWTPTGVQAGTYNTLITVSDGQLSASQPLQLVAAAAAVPPSVLITVTPSFPATLGQSVALQVTATGVANISSLTLTINGQPIALDSQGRATFVPSAAGHYSVVATAIDVDGQTGTATDDLQVRDLANTIPPSATLALPATGSVLTNATSVIGTVADGNLKNYTLTLAPLGSTSSILLGSGTSTVSNASLGTVDPSKLTNGAYLLTLTVTDLSGQTSVDTSVIEIDTAVKAGSFSTSASDLTTSLDGVSISFTRYYQSVNATVSGHVGNGWVLGGFDPQITTNLPPNAQASSGAYSAFQIGTRVYFNLPDGTRAGFTFTPTSAVVGPLTIYHPNYTADAGVGYTLDSADAQLENDGGTLNQVGTGLPYNPTSGRFGTVAWTITAPNGTLYDYSATGTLLDITSSGGIKLSASSSGLVGP